LTSPDETSKNADELHDRFAKTAQRIATREERAREALRQKLRAFVELSGDERVLDAGAGTGGLAFAIAPLVREVIAVDLVPALLDEGRKRAGPFPNVTFVEGDVTQLDFEDGSFDVAGTVRTLHHVPRPELVVAELVRVTRFGGRVLIIDQIAPIDPLAGVELDRFERARDPSHMRTLPDTDVRALLEMNSLVLRRSSFEQEERDLEPYLDLAGCEGEPRQQAAALAPVGGSVTIGWYLAAKPVPAA
jgi:ubiquinone/menaquinone biosynthesis C-methylase UbiE